MKKLAGISRVVARWFPKLYQRTKSGRRYYVNELEEFRKVNKLERRGESTQGIFLRHDNVRPCRRQNNETIHCLGFECLPHPP